MIMLTLQDGMYIRCVLVFNGEVGISKAPSLLVVVIKLDLHKYG